MLTESSYRKLVKDLRGILQEGRRRAEAQASQVLVETTWQLGKRITEEGLRDEAGYGDSVMEDVAEDLGVDVSVIRRAVIFFEQHKKHAPRRLNLTMAHYQELMALADPRERTFYAELAAREAMTRDALRRAIRRDAFGAMMNGPRGEKTERLKRPHAPTYIYKAVVERVVDGDTLLVRIDLGFAVWKVERVRLAGVDAPPLDRAKGRHAFEYVRDQMAKVAFVVVKTNKIDIYGRYVADVFYSFREKDAGKIFETGRWLNQELLGQGLARLM